MYVCICKGITESRIQEAVHDGACRLRDLRQRLGVCGGCGKCAGHAKEVLDSALRMNEAHDDSAVRAA